MEKERLQKAGDYILDGVLIVGSSGARINVSDQVQELNLLLKQFDKAEKLTDTKTIWYID